MSIFSERSIELVAQLQKVDPTFSDFTLSAEREARQLDDAMGLMIAHEDLIFHRLIFTHKQFLRESLHTSLLHDLHDYFFPVEVKDNREEEEEDTSLWGRVKLGLLAIAGTIYNICNGFDGSVSILTLFIGIPVWTVFVVGLALASVYVVLFFGLDFVYMSENLHIRLSEARQMLDCFYNQTQLTETLIEKTKARLQMEQNNLAKLILLAEDELQPTEVMRWIMLLETLSLHQQELHHARTVYLAELDKYYVRLLKWLMVGLAGLLYFNSGFFAGQVFASVVLSAILVTEVSLISWPVLLISCSVGLAALLSVFLFSDRLNIENLVGRWIGLDIDKINQLPDDKVVKPNLDYLCGAKDQLCLQMKTHERFLLMGNKIKQREDVLDSQELLKLST